MTTEAEIIGDAFRLIGVVAHDESMTADQLETGKRTLRRLMLSWQNHGYSVWLLTEGEIPLTTAISYAMPERSMRVHSVRYRDASGIDMPLEEMTRQKYNDLPVKTSAGIPAGWFYDRQRETGTLYIWQRLAAVTTETLRVTYERPIVAGDDPIDVPPEWEQAAVYNLAAALAPMYGGTDVSSQAAFELSLALAADREGSVWLGEECD